MFEMSGIILAGGENRRLGIDKAELLVDGISILERTIEILERIFAQVIVVSNVARDIEAEDAKQVKDIAQGKGALGGIYTGLKHAVYERSFVVACDMPYIVPRLVELVASRQQCDVVVPYVQNQYEPLFAVYSKNCLPIIEKLIQSDKLKISDLYERCKVDRVGEEALRKADGSLESFFNINTPKDLMKLRRCGKKVV